MPLPLGMGSSLYMRPEIRSIVPFDPRICSPIPKCLFEMIDSKVMFTPLGYVKMALTVSYTSRWSSLVQCTRCPDPITCSGSIPSDHEPFCS